MKKTALAFVVVVLLSACGGEDVGQTCATPVTRCTLGGTLFVGADCVCVKDGQQSEGKVIR